MSDEKTEPAWKEKLKQQQWFQELETAWNALDTKQQEVAKWAGLSFACIAIVFSIYSIQSKVGTLESEVEEKEALIDLINRASESSRVKSGGAQNINLRGMVASVSGMQGLPEGSLEVLEERPTPAKGPMQETLSVVRAKGISVRAVGDLLTSFDNPAQPLKIRNLEIETQPEESVLHMKFYVSTFQSKEEPQK